MATLLVIDDDPFQRDLAHFSLVNAGHRVQVAPDGQAGLEMLRQQRPDLVVCDVNMPGLDGFGVLAAVRGDPQLAALPIILLTALSERGDMRKGMASGADDYLPKPYDPKELVDAVAAVLARHDARHQSTVELVKERFTAALKRQEDILTSQYEHKLQNQISSRWETQLTREGQLRLPGATLLLANLFTALRSDTGEAPNAALASAMLQSARDSLFLFGAVQVLPYGEDVLAVFVSDKDDHTTPASARAARAAFALRAAVAAALRKEAAQTELAVALHKGELVIIRIQDPLHGVGGSAPVPGAALTAVAELRHLAASRGWAVAASPQLLESLPLQTAVIGDEDPLGTELRLK